MADKNPNRIVDNLSTNDKFQKAYGDTIKTPLDEFKNYEDFLTVGPDFFDEAKYYGAPLSGFGAKFNTPYPQIREAYAKSKGKFANVALTDPEIKKYFDERMARRNALYERVKKVPEDKWKDFAYNYGYFSDPFDFEGDPDDVISPNEFIDSFDVSYGDWDTLEDYLKEKGY